MIGGRLSMRCRGAFFDQRGETNGQTTFAVSDGQPRVRAAAVEAHCCDLVFRNWRTDDWRQYGRVVVRAGTDDRGGLVSRGSGNLRDHSGGSRLLNYFGPARERTIRVVSCVDDRGPGRFVGFA